MTPSIIEQANKLALQTKLNRAASLRRRIIQGEKLSALGLIEYVGFPAFHVNDDNTEVTVTDKYEIVTVHERIRNQFRQRPSGLWHRLVRG